MDAIVAPPDLATAEIRLLQPHAAEDRARVRFILKSSFTAHRTRG